MKKILLIALLCFVTTQAHARSPMQADRISASEVQITSLEDSLEIYSVSTNRNNCMSLLSLNKGHILRYGETFNILALSETSTTPYFANEISHEALLQIDLFINMGIKQYCNILEVIIDSSAGEWIFSWENQ